MSTVIGASRKFDGIKAATSDYPPLCTTPFTDVVKHLCYHILPLGGEHEWVLDKNIRKICESIEQFNGKRIVAISTKGEGDTKPFISPDDVIEKFRALGVADIEYMFFKNKKRLREVVSFVPMLSKVITSDPNHVVFYGHCKGVTHPNPTVIPHKWADAMYETVYENWDQVKPQLEQFGASGSFKKYGTFKTIRNHRWHYSGTFYWFRCASVFPRNWTQVDQVFYGTESWLGLLFRPFEAGCLFHDFTGDVYKATDSEIENKLQEWRQGRLCGQPLLSAEEYKQYLIDSKCQARVTL